MDKGLLVILSGASSVGKGSICEALRNDPELSLKFSVSITTSPPKEGEVDGVDYFFITKQEFARRLENNCFLEHAQFAGNDYGTPRDYVTNLLDQGVNVLLEIEVQGAMQVHEKRPDAVMVFIAPPSFEELAARLRGRGTEDEEKVLKRLETAKEELKQQDRFDYVIVNDELDRAVEELKDILAKRRT